MNNDRYLAIVYLEDGIPTGMSASYFADIPGDRDDVQGLFQGNPGFQVLGDFADRPCADAVISAKLKLMTERIPQEQRANWPN
jgi:hypothetical protein